MPDQHVSDRLNKPTDNGPGDFIWRQRQEIARLTQAFSDQHQIALSYEAQVEQQAQQIQALRGEQARLRAENERLTVIELAATKLLFDNGGPTGGDTYFGIPDEFVLTTIEEFQALEAAVRSVETLHEDDGKSDRDNRPAFSQVDLEDPIVALPRGVIVALLENCKHRDDVLIAWDALQTDVEQLRAENERRKSSSDYWKTMADAARQENERLKAQNIAFRRRRENGLCVCDACIEKQIQAFPVESST